MEIRVESIKRRISPLFCWDTGNLRIFAFSYQNENEIHKSMDNRLLDNKLPYLVADMGLAAWGRKEIGVQYITMGYREMAIYGYAVDGNPERIGS